MNLQRGFEQFQWNPARLTTLCEAHGDGSTWSTIAAILGCSRGSVAGRLSRLREQAERHGLNRWDVAGMLAEDWPLETIAKKTRVEIHVVEVLLAEIRRDLGPQAR